MGSSWTTFIGDRAGMVARRGGDLSVADEGIARGQGGRPAGIPNRDKAELRALLQEKVHEFTELRRQQDLAELPPDQHEFAIREGRVQTIVEDYDPVVAMALVAADRRSSIELRVKCNSEVAGYVRPKLKSVEVTADPEAYETLEMRRKLSEELVGLLNAAASARKDESTRVLPKPAAPTEE